jgi:next-to-BRCA1 protein 1
VTLDPQNSGVYKQLYRAAKAKLKLRIKVTSAGNEGKMILVAASHHRKLTEMLKQLPWFPTM